MQILINDGDKIMFAEVSRIEAEDGTLKFYGSCNDNLIASIAYEQYNEYSAEKEAEYSLLYLTDLISNQNKIGAIRPESRFVKKKEKIVRIFNPEE